MGLLLARTRSRGLFCLEYLDSELPWHNRTGYAITRIGLGSGTNEWMDIEGMTRRGAASHRIAWRGMA
jgi:hypothetical protein